MKMLDYSTRSIFQGVDISWYQEDQSPMLNTLSNGRSQAHYYEQTYEISGVSRSSSMYFNTAVYAPKKTAFIALTLAIGAIIPLYSALTW